MTILYNQKWSRERRKGLRREATEAEKVLWDLLRDRKVLGVKFRRQYGVGQYIVDFYAAQLKFVIEVDGMVHENPEAKEYDRVRDQYLQDVGMKVKRFKNYEVLYSPERVLMRITELIQERMVAFPSLLRRG